MDGLDSLLASSPLDKLMDVLQNAPRGAIELAIIKYCKEFVAMRVLLEQNGIFENEFDKYVFENNNELEILSNDIYIDLTAKILGQEG